MLLELVSVCLFGNEWDANASVFDTAPIQLLVAAAVASIPLSICLLYYYGGACFHFHGLNVGDLTDTDAISRVSSSHHHNLHRIRRSGSIRVCKDG